MAVNSITFGGVNSADFGIYISGEGVFNAPKRDVEMIDIPGRNGSFALDNGRFENITVTYPAFNFEPDDYETFMQNLSDFRNAICSQKGYQRLTDSFHPDEYRMAVYKDGLEIKPIKYNTASEFDIVFDCKPQRYLTSGESAIEVESGDTITNPTLFEAGPLLEVEGYGNIELNNDIISIQDGIIGQIKIAKESQTNRTFSGSFASNTITHTITLEPGQYNIGDTILIDGSNLLAYAKYEIRPKSGYSPSALPAIGKNYEALVVGTPATLIPSDSPKSGGPFNIIIPGSGTVYGTYSYTIDLAVQYDGANTITCTSTISITGTGLSYLDHIDAYIKTPNILVDSTVSVLTGAMNIDLDIGEAWIETGGTITPLNGIVSFPAELPKLKSGSNLIIYNNNITSLKVVPRWWKV